MALNDPLGSQVASRAPRLRVLCNNQIIPGCKKATVRSNNWYQADRFDLTFALVMGSTYSAQWWSQLTDLQLNVEFSVDGGNSFTSMIQGGVDSIRLDPVTGQVMCEGRDLSYLLIETKTEAKWANQTSSQVATTLAKNHNLTPVVTPTTTLVTRYFSADHSISTTANFHRESTEWDLLVYLAQQENFDLFVQGTSLYFQPKQPQNATPYVIQYSHPGASPRLNVISLELERSLILAKDIQVVVRSWNTSQAQPITVTAKKTGTKSASADSGTTPATQRYVYTFPNLTRDQALQKATQLAADLTQHERIISVRQPGILPLTPRTMLQLVGTGTSWDQPYFIDSIDREMSFEGGFEQTIRAKNRDTSSQVSIG